MIVRVGAHLWRQRHGCALFVNNMRETLDSVTAMWLDNDMTYRIVSAPKFSDMIEHDCADCGHESLTRPVFLAGPAGTFAVGTGCAARLLGLPAAEVAADAATLAIVDMIATSPRTANIYSDLNATLPARITAKYTEWIASRTMATPAEIATMIDAYKAIIKVRSFRTIRQAIAA